MSSDGYAAWPELPYHAWKDTIATLHRWTQIVGKVRLARAPMMDGWWQVPLYATSRGLTTSPIPAGDRTFQIDFDFLAHELQLLVSDGTEGTMRLYARSVADFYEELMSMLSEAELETKIWTTPVELLEPNPAPFDQDHEHASYDGKYVERWWRILAQVDQILKEYTARFVGRVSPVQFYWGTFDHSVSLYSGRRIDTSSKSVIERYAFDMEQVESGFWPGNEKLEEPAFFSFTAPPPAGYAERKIEPNAARFDQGLGEFILRYEDVRSADDSKKMLLDFLRTTYDAGARPPAWDRQKLDWQPPAMH